MKPRAEFLLWGRIRLAALAGFVMAGGLRYWLAAALLLALYVGCIWRMAFLFRRAA